MTATMIVSIAAATVAATPAPAPPPAQRAAEVARLQPIDLAALRAAVTKARGRTFVVHLWASWCYPCLEEMARVDRFARELRARGGDVLSVSLDTADGAPHAARALRELGPNLTRTIVKIDDPDAFIAGVAKGWDGSIPALFAYAPSGVLRKQVIGEIDPHELERWFSEVIGWTAPTNATRSDGRRALRPQIRSGGAANSGKP